MSSKFIVTGLIALKILRDEYKLCSSLSLTVPHLCLESGVVVSIRKGQEFESRPKDRLS
jgi:hypothetical protein